MTMTNTCLAEASEERDEVPQALLGCFWTSVSYLTIKRNSTKLMNRYVIFLDNCFCSDLGQESALQGIKSGGGNETLSLMEVSRERWSLLKPQTRTSHSYDPVPLRKHHPVAIA